MTLEFVLNDKHVCLCIDDFWIERLEKQSITWSQSTIQPVIFFDDNEPH